VAAQGEDAGAEENRQALEKYSIDLTERGDQGKLDPVSGAMMRFAAPFKSCSDRTKNIRC